MAGTYDAATGTSNLYVDGVQVGTTSSNPAKSIFYNLPFGSSTDLVIGNYGNPTAAGCENLYVNAGIDEVEIFSRALSAAEILALYEAQSQGKCKIPNVKINIKPGSDPNSINLCSKGVTPTTIWGSENFDVSKIDIKQITLASAPIKSVGKTAKKLCSIYDVGSFDENLFDHLNPNPDGFDDLTCHFVTTALDLDSFSAAAPLKIVGCDQVREDPSHLCESIDAGYFEFTLDEADSVNIVKSCK